jgi:hypothetical protein
VGKSGDARGTQKTSLKDINMISLSVPTWIHPLAVCAPVELYSEVIKQEVPEALLIVDGVCARPGGIKKILMAGGLMSFDCCPELL